MMKKQSVVALATLLLIPLVTVLGGMLSNLINPEIAAGHPNYVRNWHLLNLLKQTLFFASIAAAGVLWLLVCLLVIRSKSVPTYGCFWRHWGPLGSPSWRC